jgi:hypothetical protein
LNSETTGVRANTKLAKYSSAAIREMIRFKTGGTSQTAWTMEELQA